MHSLKRLFKTVIYQEKALTMVELIIAAALAGLVAAGAYSFYFTALQSWERGVESRGNQQNARLAMRSIERDIRYADWIWIGEDWEDHWMDDGYIEPGEGEQLYYSFFADRKSFEVRPHFTFNRIWLGGDNTLYFRKSILLTGQNSIYHINTAPFPLADNIDEITFRYSGESGELLDIFLKAGAPDQQAGQTELRSTVLMRNLR